MKTAITFFILVAAAIGLMAISKPPAHLLAPESTTIAQNGVFTGPEFQFTYRPDRPISTSTAISWRNNTDSTGAMRAQIAIPSTVQPQTNFRGATFTVGTSTDPSEITNCTTAQNGETSKGETMIANVPFNTFTLSDAGAGNFYDTTSYRTVRNNTCYSIEYTIHSTNLANYDPTQDIRAFDSMPIIAELESMVQSFKFTK